MRWKSSRLFWILDGILLLSALLFSAYKVVTRVLPLPVPEQRRKVSPEAQILEYYRQYPERYIRISKESWEYDQLSRTALHSLTLTNTATVPYSEIEIQFSYENSGGKSLHAQNIKVPGFITALGKMDLKKIKVTKVPPAAERVVTKVIQARTSR